MCNYSGIEVSNKSIDICVIDEKGQRLLETSVSTEEDSLSQLFADLYDSYGSIHMVVEACPLAEWVSKLGIASGHKIAIICARDAKKALPKKRKTDKLDAQGLAQLARTEWYIEIHKKSEEGRNFRSYATSRKQLCKTAQAVKSSVRGLFRAHGIILPSGNNRDFMSDVKEAFREAPTMLKAAIRPLLKVVKIAEDEQRKMYKKQEQLCKKDETAKLLTSAPGVGAATVTAFIATIDDPTRFSTGDKVASYLGIVPSIYQSGDTEYRGRITKEGDTLCRWLLVECAHVLLYRCRDEHPLKQWGLALAEKKGMAKAKVAVARKLACLLHHIWITGEPYDLAKAQANVC